MTFYRNQLITMATSLDISENEVEIYHLFPKRFHMVKRLYILRYSTKYASYFAMPYKKLINEPRFFLSYWTKVHQILYRDIIYAVNAHIEVAISDSVSVCRSDKCMGVDNFATKLVAMTTSLNLSEKEGGIDQFSFNTYLSIAIQYLPYGTKIVKISPVDPEILRLRAKKSGITQNWLPWQCPFRNWKNWTGSRKVTQISSSWWKNGENLSSRYWDSFAHSKKK